MLLILFLSCAGPDDMTLAAEGCRRLPGVNMDAAGLAFSEGVIDEAERELWRDRVPSIGLDTLGIAGLGVIRANLSCRAEGGVDGLVAVTREQPVLDPLSLSDRRDIRDLEREALRLELHLVDTPDGRRVRAGVAEAREALAAAQALRDRGEPEAALEALEALYRDFPDPLLLWEIADIQERQRVLATARWQLVADERLVFQHSGQRTVDLVLTVRAGDVERRLERAALPPEVELVLPLPEPILQAVAGGAELEVTPSEVTVFKPLE